MLNIFAGQSQFQRETMGTLRRKPEKIELFECSELTYCTFDKCMFFLWKCKIIMCKQKFCRMSLSPDLASMNHEKFIQWEDQSNFDIWASRKCVLKVLGHRRKKVRQLMLEIEKNYEQSHGSIVCIISYYESKVQT